jgi:deazaflavin-dependent oxidoreductase (nitroreductase family)
MPKEMSKSEQRVVQAVTKTLGGFHTWLYRLSDGRFGSMLPGGLPALLLTTRGRKSGELRTSPLLFLRDGEKVILVASKGGFPEHPAWYLNLQAHPEVEIQLGSERIKMRAETATPEKKARLWPRLCALYPPYQGYQAKTDREIPVVILRPM